MMEAATITATAEQGQLSHSKSTTEQLQISTPRQARLLQAIMNEPKTTLELERYIVQCRNVWEICLQLRRKGWKIETISEPFSDQDGRPSKKSWYSLDASQIPQAQAAIELFRTTHKSKHKGGAICVFKILEEPAS